MITKELIDRAVKELKIKESQYSFGISVTISKEVWLKLTSIIYGLEEENRRLIADNNTIKAANKMMSDEYMNIKRRIDAAK